MRLIPKARPVRIRIKSSGDEHSSFDSLKRALCFDDLREPASDGRLSNWLKQQDKSRVADKIDAIRQEFTSDIVSESAYLKFFCAIFCDEIDESAIQSKSDLYEWWEKTIYTQGWEFEKLKKEITEIRLKANKLIDDRKMKKDFDYALEFYGEHKESRTKDEWLEIFRMHENTQESNGDYWWIYYELTQNKYYLDLASKNGNVKAKELEKANDRFARITKSNFKLIFNRLPSHFNGDFYGLPAAGEISLIKAETPEDVELKNELAEIIELWKKVKATRVDQIGFIVYSYFKNSDFKFKYLEPEMYFIQGLLREMDATEGALQSYKLSAEKGYKPAILKVEELSSGNEKCKSLVINGDLLSADTLTLKEAGFTPNFDVFNVITFSQSQKNAKININRDRIGKILPFIIKHLFDGDEA